MKASIVQQDEAAIELHERIGGMAGSEDATTLLAGLMGAFLAFIGCVSIDSLAKRLPLFVLAALMGLLAWRNAQMAFNTPTERTLRFDRNTRQLTILEKGRFGVRQVVVPFADIDTISSAFQSIRGAGVGGDVLKLRLKDGKMHTVCHDKLDLSEARQWCGRLNGFIAAS